jgi:protein-S-isoprenylcysteine O-methyltransferase Ste14
MIFYVIGFPLAVGSTLALYFGFILYSGIVLRTFLEDNTLKLELKGYREYAREVRYKLIPFIW